MMDLMRRRKTLEIAPIQSALPTSGNMAPSATPNTIAMKIHAVRETRFIVRPILVFDATHRRKTSWVGGSSGRCAASYGKSSDRRASTVLLPVRPPSETLRDHPPDK